MPSSKARISNSRPRPARSFSTTRKSFWRMATGGKRNSRRTFWPTRLTGEWRRFEMNLPALMFYLFSAVSVLSGFMVITARNPVHSVLFLILAFFKAAGLFVLLGAEFLAMILVVVYVGAVAVLFLFVVMMLDINFTALRRGSLQYLPFGVLIGLILVAELAMVGSVWVLKP